MFWSLVLVRVFLIFGFSEVECFYFVGYIFYFYKVILVYLGFISGLGNFLFYGLWIFLKGFDFFEFCIVLDIIFFDKRVFVFDYRSIVECL